MSLNKEHYDNQNTFIFVSNKHPTKIDFEEINLRK